LGGAGNASMFVGAAFGLCSSGTPVVGGVGVLMSKFSGGGAVLLVPGGVVVIVLLAPDGLVVVVLLSPDGVVVVVLLSPDGVVVVVLLAPEGAVVVVVVEGGSGAVAVSGAAAAFAAAAALVDVPGAIPGVPGSKVTGGGESGSAPLGIVCAPLVAGVGAGSACAVATPKANTPDARTNDSTFMFPSSFIPPCLTPRSVHPPGVHKQCAGNSERRIRARVGRFFSVELRFPVRARHAPIGSPLPVARSLSLASPIALALLAGAAAVVGCAQNEAPSGPAVTFNPCASVTLAPDPTASSTELGGIAAAAALWNQSAGSALAMATPGSAAAAPAPTPTLPIHFQTAAAPIHGLYDAPDGQVFINNDLSGSELSITIAHEVGHSFGLVHIPPDVRPSLMNPGNLTVSITPEDIATLAGLWGRCGSLDAGTTE
jgi:hypothetical protein